MSRPQRTELTRLRHKARAERTELDALLDNTRVGHVGFAGLDGSPVVIPTAIVRDGERILAHGSTGSGWLRLLADGRPACLAVTALDGVVVARSAFESSLRYRSAVMFGSWTPVNGDDKAAALDRITDALVPGRTTEIRRPTQRELDATLVLALPIGEWSLKISDGWPEDPPADVAGDAWAGVVPMRTCYGSPRPAPDLRSGLPVPASVVKLAARTT